MMDPLLILNDHKTDQPIEENEGSAKTLDDALNDMNLVLRE